MADPQALLIAVAAQQAIRFVGMPEANLALAQAVVYLATAPKSNAVYQAYTRAAEDAGTDVAEPVPLHLRNEYQHRCEPRKQSPQELNHPAMPQHFP
jgi:putative ATPase